MTFPLVLPGVGGPACCITVVADLLSGSPAKICFLHRKCLKVVFDSYKITLKFLAVLPEQNEMQKLLSMVATVSQLEKGASH